MSKGFTRWTQSGINANDSCSRFLCLCQIVGRGRAEPGDERIPAPEDDQFRMEEVVPGCTRKNRSKGSGAGKEGSLIRGKSLHRGAPPEKREESPANFAHPLKGTERTRIVQEKNSIVPVIAPDPQKLLRNLFKSFFPGDGLKRSFSSSAHSLQGSCKPVPGINHIRLGQPPDAGLQTRHGSFVGSDVFDPSILDVNLQKTPAATIIRTTGQNDSFGPVQWISFSHKVIPFLEPGLPRDTWVLYPFSYRWKSSCKGSGWALRRSLRRHI